MTAGSVHIETRYPDGRAATEEQLTFEAVQDVTPPDDPGGGPGFAQRQG